jgi:hypothetical protein
MNIEPQLLPFTSQGIAVGRQAPLLRVPADLLIIVTATSYASSSVLRGEWLCVT